MDGNPWNAAHFQAALPVNASDWVISGDCAGSDDLAWQMGWTASEMPSTSNSHAPASTSFSAPSQLTSASFTGLSDYGSAFNLDTGTSSFPSDFAVDGYGASGSTETMNPWRGSRADVSQPEDFSGLSDSFYSQPAACSSSSSIASAGYLISDAGSFYQHAASTSSLSLPGDPEYPISDTDSFYHQAASSDFSDRRSSSSRFSSLDPTSGWNEFSSGPTQLTRSSSPELEFADDGMPAPATLAPAVVEPPATTTRKARKAKHKQRRQMPGDIRDEFELEWKRADTKWLEDGVWSEYVDFPHGLALTQHKTIFRLERVHGIPHELPHPEIHTAFLLSFPESVVPAGMTADNFWRDMCPHSWGQSTGARGHADAKLSGFFFPGRSANEKIECRRAVPECRGVWACESLDPEFINAKRRELDPNLQVELAAATLRIREQQEETMVGKVLTYLRSLERLHCTAVLADGSPCPGTVSDVRPFKSPMAGKKHGLACNNRAAAVLPEFRHSTHYIQEDIDETMFLSAKRGERIIEDDDINDECARVLSLQQASGAARTCDFNHFRDGAPFSAKLIRIPCPAKISLFIPDEKMYKDLRLTMIAYPDPEKFHEHPTALGSKCPRGAKEKYKECVRAYGANATVARVEIASSTRDILGGKTPSTYDPSLINTRLKYRLIREVRLESASAADGGNVAEEVAAYIARQQEIPDPQKRYIHCFRSSEGKRIFIGAHPPLLSRIHDLRTLDFDTSFKPVKDNLHIFEINGLLASHARVITVLRVWMEAHDRATFETVWSDVFGLVLSLTGHPLRFKPLHAGGKLLGLNSDMEAAPLLAFADAIWKTMSDARRAQIGDPESTLLYVLRICKMHYNRGIDDTLKHLPSSGAGSDSDSDDSGGEDDAGDDPDRSETLTRQRLRGLRHFHSQQQLDALEQAISSSGDKILEAWWKHKKMHRWLLPGLVSFLSHIDSNDWHLIPASTNIGEGQHRWNNVHTGEGMGIIESMQKYEQLDIEVAADLAQAAITGDLRNMHNDPVDRYAKRNARNLATMERTQRKRTVDQQVQLCKIALSEVEQELRAARAEVKSKTSTAEKDAAKQAVRLLKTELDVAKDKLAQAKAEVNSNSSGRTRPPRPGRNSSSSVAVGLTQPAPAPSAAPSPSPSSAAVMLPSPAPVSVSPTSPSELYPSEKPTAESTVRRGRSSKRPPGSESTVTAPISAPPAKRRRRDSLSNWQSTSEVGSQYPTARAYANERPDLFKEEWPNLIHLIQ